jgi:hypothetical protein
LSLNFHSLIFFIVEFPQLKKSYLQSKVPFWAILGKIGRFFHKTSGHAAMKRKEKTHFLEFNWAENFL